MEIDSVLFPASTKTNKATNTAMAVVVEDSVTTAVMSRKAILREAMTLREGTAALRVAGGVDLSPLQPEEDH